MKVKFANTEVDIAELRQGAVVLEYFDATPCAYHILKFLHLQTDLDGKTEAKLIVVDGHGEQQFFSSELTWPTPH